MAVLLIAPSRVITPFCEDIKFSKVFLLSAGFPDRIILNQFFNYPKLQIIY